MLKAVVPVGKTLKVIEFEATDGGGIESFPTDLDRDGIADFVGSDNRFLYTFSSYAGSWAPPRILNIFKGQIIDVSDQPTFAHLYQEFEKSARQACADKSVSDRNGACAGYVAAATRLGHFEHAMREANKLANHSTEITLPEACAVPLVGYSCPDGKERKFHTFESALRWFLIDTGYIR